ncbi:hypothetical protein D1B31_05665 [Neobacillus notoginsengisoli]|uniref:Uncharacterized protein n=1 Tax=Neobacillus notoginsengisoli TaxID=1578198 RepID=A0A417YX02_9BACI|nr:hypothetical protein [Neobacillus notoginsengisoli]RHW42123.1 hypothetical protein D1B31_05665 [Neobacillus notoginsengisoli]
MRMMIYFSLLVSALVCSLIHVFRQSKLETSPGEIVLHAFFLSFTFIGISSLWWILTVKSEMNQAFGVLFNGLFLGLVTHMSMRLAFYLNRHRDTNAKVRNSHDYPHYI